MSRAPAPVRCSSPRGLSSHRMTPEQAVAKGSGTLRSVRCPEPRICTCTLQCRQHHMPAAGV
jgi:hypothetical protein